MESQPRTYTDREINHFLSDIKATLEKQNASLERIETQVLKTNVRVTKSEEKILVLENTQKQRRQDFFWAVGILVTISIFLFNYFK